MAKSVRVKINTAAWAAAVTSNAAYVEGPAQAVASKLVGGTVDLIEAPARRGGSRVRARVSHGTNHFQEANTNALVSALAATLPLGRS